MTVLWPNGGAATTPEEAGMHATAEFGIYDPFGTGAYRHNGIDLVGWSTIIAPVNGVVTFAGYNGAAGNEVRIKEDGTGDVFRLLHNRELWVQTGQRVSQGQQISVMGTTGSSTGVHCHEETRPGGGNAINPRDYYASRNASTTSPSVPKEDEMTQSIKVNHSQFGSHLFAVGEEFISHHADGVQADVTRQVMSATDELHPLTTQQTVALLDGLGIPRDVLIIDAKGARVLNPETGQHESNGVWSRRREAVALAKKNADALAALSAKIAPATTK